MGCSSSACSFFFSPLFLSTLAAGPSSALRLSCRLWCISPLLPGLETLSIEAVHFHLLPDELRSKLTKGRKFLLAIEGNHASSLA